MKTTSVRRWSSDRVFYVAVPIVAGAAIFYGFARSWFLRPFLPAPPHPATLTPLITFHAIVFTAWLVLSIAQPFLIGRRRYSLHRGLGYIGAGVAALMVMLMLATAIVSMRAGDIGNFDHSGLFLSVNSILAAEFGIIMFLAIHYRKQPETHKRLVLLSFVALLPPALSRWPTVIGPPIFTCDLIIITGMIYDKVTRGQVHSVWRWSLPVMFALGVMMIAIGIQPATQAFADKIIMYKP